jgi:hypothetical protein
MQHPSWTASVKKHYDYDSLAELQEYWLAWVSAGSNSVEKFAKAKPSPVRPANVAGVDALAGRTVQASAQASAPASTIAPTAQSALSDLALLGSQRAEPIDSNPTALASTVAQGWYARKRLEAQNPAGREIAPRGQLSKVGTPMVPPSVRQSGPYQSAHPQPEQPISRSPQRSRAPQFSGPSGPQFRIIDGGTGNVANRFR